MRVWVESPRRRDRLYLSGWYVGGVDAFGLAGRREVVARVTSLLRCTAGFRTAER
ncbi:hypothetical protein [Streptomyces sp. NPDC001401]|uniref:hypothetical protein n=1 Tax=Streptomyces sp. NPDC001401 TaxID=3364570 RepID=UPI003685257F